VNDDSGKALRDWILFLVGVSIVAIGGLMLVALVAVWIVTGRPADPGLIGFAAVILGYGNILLAQFLKNGNGNGGPR
jgi:hypothetical protein